MSKAKKKFANTIKLLKKNKKPVFTKMVSGNLIKYQLEPYKATLGLY